MNKFYLLLRLNLRLPKSFTRVKIRKLIKKFYKILVPCFVHVHDIMVAWGSIYLKDRRRKSSKDWSRENPGGVRRSCGKTFWSGGLERKDKSILSAMNVYWLRCIVLTSFIYQLNLNELCNVSKYFSTWASTIHFHNFSLFFDRRVCDINLSCRWKDKKQFDHPFYAVFQ